MMERKPPLTLLTAALWARLSQAHPNALKQKEDPFFEISLNSPKHVYLSYRSKGNEGRTSSLPARSVQSFEMADGFLPNRQPIGEAVSETRQLLNHGQKKAEYQRQNQEAELRAIRRELEKIEKAMIQLDPTLSSEFARLKKEIYTMGRLFSDQHSVLHEVLTEMDEALHPLGSAIVGEVGGGRIERIPCASAWTCVILTRMQPNQMMPFTTTVAPNTPIATGGRFAASLGPPGRNFVTDSCKIFKEGDNHDDGENEDPEGFEPSAPYRELVLQPLNLLLDEFGCCSDDQSAQ